LSIDVFEGRHQGLILAEMEIEKQGNAGELDLISFGLKEVTADPFFTGGSLAMMTDETFRLGMALRLREYENLR